MGKIGNQHDMPGRHIRMEEREEEEGWNNSVEKVICDNENGLFST